MTFDIVYGVSPLTYLACFGGADRSVIGFYPVIEDGIGGNCHGVPVDLAWIACVGFERLVLDPDEGSSSPGLVLAVDPAGGVAMPERGQWIEVTGRYDHPAAQACTWEGATEGNVIHCRAAFVVHSARPVSSP